MSLELLREKQKLVYWVVALVVIPSFVLVWGDSSRSGWSGSGPDVGMAGGRKVAAREFSDFQHRLRAVTGGAGLVYLLPLRRPDGSSVLVPDREGHLSTLFALSHLAEARAAGLRASPTEVGTYIRRELPFGRGAADDAAFQKAYTQALQSMSITHDAFMVGVEEWLTLRRWIEAADAAPAASETAWLYFARDKARLACRVLPVQVTEAMKDKALERLRGITPQAPQGKDESALAAIEAYLKKHAEDRRWWSTARWRFEYLLAPFAAYTPEAPSEKDLEELFGRTPGRFGEGKKLAEVREAVVAAWTEERQREFAARTLEGEVDSHVRRVLSQGSTLTLAETLKDENIAARGVQGGVSGTEALPAAGLTGIATIGDSTDLPAFLDRLDAIRDPAERGKAIDLLKRGFDAEASPLSCKAGLFRIRLLDFQPGKPRVLKDEKGNVDGELKMLVLQELMLEGGMEEAKSAAAEAEKRLKEGKVEGLEGLADRVVGFQEAAEAIREKAPGETAVLPLKAGGKGFEVWQLVRRTLPGRDEFEKLPADEKDRYRINAERAEQGFLLPPYFSRTWMVRPGPALQQRMLLALESRTVEAFEAVHGDHRRGAPELPPDADY